MIILYIVGVLLFIVLIVKILFKITQVRCTSKVCLVGKTAVVTGGSSGIGYQIVLGLASRGCRVIIADVNVDQEIKDKIFKETHNSNIILKYLNLASLKCVRTFAEDLLENEEKIDILVNNAGVGNGFKDVTEDGLNYVMQVNYFSAFLLTHLLLDLLKKSNFGGRIIFTSSLCSYIHNLTADSIQQYGPNKSDRLFAYNNSKFCQICASDIFAEKLRDDGITSNCFHPYIAKTDIFTESMQGASWYLSMVFLFNYVIAHLVGKTAEEGAQTGIFLACANEMKGVTGGFYSDSKPFWKPRKVTDPEIKIAMWADSEIKVKLKQSEKIGIKIGNENRE